MPVSDGAAVVEEEADQTECQVDPINIKAIDPAAVHQIQSGQVIVDLCSVAKELVENSLDAGATSIDVRFENQGLDSIEVQDNGSGISPQNYKNVALKHYTSKLSTYADLTSLNTFGFRGEALSSLCALSRFTVVTCLQSDGSKGTKLEFETSGELKKTSTVAAQKGTMVTVEGLFHNLPVRRRELERNIKREWGKVIHLLSQYACVMTAVKFSVSQKPTKGKRMVLFSTKGNPTTRENIINVFGAKTMSALVPLNLLLELEPTSRPGQPPSGRNNAVEEIRVRGHVSRPVHGEGRQTPDRQMFYVNGRPCILPQFAKVFNEVYKSYNSSQSPFIFADIQLDTHLYDVNVSPDKRTILLHDQGRMLENMRESLVALFETVDYTVPVAQLSTQKQTPFKKLSIDRDRTPTLRQKPAARDTPHETSTTSAADHRSPSSSPDVDNFEITPARSITRAPASSKTLARDTREKNLISRWVERSTTATPTERQSDASPTIDNNDNHPTKEKERLLSKIGADRPGEDDILEDLPASESEDEPEQEPAMSAAEAIKVRDWRAHLEELRNRAYEEEPTGDAVGLSQDKGTPQKPVPLLPISPRRPPGGSGIRHAPASTKRPLIGEATITVGDHTVTTWIGPPSPKRPKLGVPASTNSQSRGRDDSESRGSLPSFGSRLSQMFAAAAQKTAGEGDSGEGNGTQESEDSVSSPVHKSNEEDEEMVEPQRDESPGEVEDIEAVSPVQSSAEDDGIFVDDSDGIDNGKNNNRTRNDGLEEETLAMAGEIQRPERAEESQNRSQTLLKGRSKRKDATLNCVQRLAIDEDDVHNQLKSWQASLAKASSSVPTSSQPVDLEDNNAEEKLSLKISKSDFGKMRIVGQFNLGFVLAVRAAEAADSGGGGGGHGGGNSGARQEDDLLIIDQHASDEKYNFERLQASTVVQTQRLVQPKTLELTALEEEIIMENGPALEANGFGVRIDDTRPVGSRCQLVSLPLSRETTFSVADLEELIVLLGDHHQPDAAVSRPSKVRKMFAMRACRSSIMIGKALSLRQMEKVVRHMGEMDKPWNCPHGRPTMRHLCGLGVWDESGKGWRES